MLRRGNRRFCAERPEQEKRMHLKLGRWNRSLSGKAEKADDDDTEDKRGQAAARRHRPHRMHGCPWPAPSNSRGPQLAGTGRAETQP
mmetsp:Transcript_66634/g.184512  ORF Transcript_66634/g.184512 Transcript_66634/m.184512 type:complete len:87 (-) Transcript_66634:188-448(-)